MMLYTGDVGVAPGTTTIQLNGTTYRYRDPYARGLVELKGGVVDTRARIRWDVIGIVGGGSLIIALSVALLATALGK